MKKNALLAAVFAVVLSLGLSACGAQGGGDAPAPSGDGEFATMGDVFASDYSTMESTFDEEAFVCAFSVDGKWYRAKVDLPEGTYDELNEVFLEDNQAFNDLLAPLEITQLDLIAETDPTQGVSDALVGKTGADVTAAGYTISTLAVNGDETYASATDGTFDYLITFDGAVPDENTDDPAGAVADLTVTDVGCQGVSWSALTL